MGTQAVAIKEAEWHLKTLNEMNCTVVQQMIEAMLGKIRWQTLQHAAKMAEERRKHIQDRHETKENQQHVEGWLVVLR